jgi:hypothetical protein
MSLTLALLVWFGLGRHPLHTTHTDLSETPGGRVTITVRSFTDDLHAAVRQRGRTVDDSAVARYLRSTIELLDPAGRSIPLTWDAARSEGDITLLTLHTTIPGGLRGTSVRQLMQMELYDDQVNVVQTRYAGQSVSLLFLPGDGPRRLR